MFADLQGSTWFSKIDLQNAFLQTPLDAVSKEITTINIKWGLYQFNFLPFGLTASRGLFQRTMDEIIMGLKGVKTYQDDLLVYGSSRPDHDMRLQKLLQRLVEANVTINLFLVLL